MCFAIILFVEISYMNYIITLPSLFSISLSGNIPDSNLSMSEDFPEPTEPKIASFFYEINLGVF